MFLVRQTLKAAQEAFADHEQVISALQAVARETEEKNQWPLVHDAYCRLADGSSKYPSTDFDAARSVLENAARQTIRLHQHLSVLPAERASQTIHSVIALSYPDFFKNIEPTVLLLPDLNYYEFDLAAVISHDPIFPQFVPPPEMHGKVIRLSGPDAHSPLSWPILAHEFGHAIETEHKLSADLDARTAGRFANIDPKLRLMVESYYRELIADVIAAHAMGPSTVLALIRFEMLLSALSGYEPVSNLSHPSAAARVTLIRELLGASVVDDFRATLSAYGDYRSWVVANRVIANNKAVDEWMDLNVLPHIRQAAIQVVSDLKLSLFGSADVERAKRLANRIDRAIPPSAIRWTSKASIRALLGEALSKQSGADEAYAKCVSYLGERAATPGEILAAGYLHRESTYEKVIDHVLRKWNRTSNWSDNVTSIAAVFRSDRLLAAAVDTTNVHTGLVKAASITAELSPLETLRDPPGGAPFPAPPPGRSSVLGDLEIFQELIRPDLDRLTVTPLIDPVTQLGPSSLDVRLGTNALVITNVNIDALDPLRPVEQLREQLSAYTRLFNISVDEPFVLHPGEFALAATLEYVRMPRHLAGRLEGRSSYGRAGLLVHATAGFIDPGFEGTVTFELMNHGKAPIKLYPGARIGQLCFFPCEARARYSTKVEQKYQGALLTIASRFFEDVEYRWYRQDGRLPRS